MAKVKLWRDRRLFCCPACNDSHQLNGGWDFNGDLERPTFNPSVLVTGGGEGRVCHSYIADGMIRFLSNCTHALAGKTVALPDWGTSPDAKFYEEQA